MLARRQHAHHRVRAGRRLRRRRGRRQSRRRGVLERARRRVEAGDGVRLREVGRHRQTHLARPRNAIRRARLVGSAAPTRVHSTNARAVTPPGLKRAVTPVATPSPAQCALSCFCARSHGRHAPRRRTATEHMAAAALESPAADVAVLFPGWLNVVIPDRGAQARASLVDPLGADVIVAGTFRPSDCPNKRHARGRCLLPRLRGLEPISKLGLSPMLRMRELRARGVAVVRSRLPRLQRARDVQRRDDLRAGARQPQHERAAQLSDYSRSLALCEEHERARGRNTSGSSSHASNSCGSRRTRRSR